MTLAADLWEEKKYLKDLPIFSFPHYFTKTLCLLNKQFEIEVLLMVVLAESVKHIVGVLYSFLCYLDLCHQFVKFIILLLFIQNILNS